MYRTPELLLVGAAQTLVLGDSPVFDQSPVGCNPDVIDLNQLYIDEDGW